MPNWCENVARINAPSENEARALFEAIKAGLDYRGVQNVICSRAGEPANEVDGDHALWNGETRAMHGDMRLSRSDVEMSWASRWEPPITFYEQLESEGFAVNAMYLEAETRFCGTYADGQQTNVQYEVRADIPALIEEQWGADLFDWIFDDGLAGLAPPSS